ncbi:putative exonuclease 1 isoform X1 [Apostichopus japonicus]|uniref:Exonuclease 1 n=1 Tax=Stichopus japonicus TaxID=307972 RepID=A0A2G8K719_STIJA|nr:putative exonuclease 1 isoform X1 [Apostichopus japonicus]
MGIQGLLPFLKDATEAINIRKYRGHAVAVDTYCWIHRGAVACALQLAKGEKCDQRRELYSQKGKQLLREGKPSEARDAFVKCINVTSEMALEVMKAARSLGVDCIVAPYEADSQLAYLEKNGFVQAIITEDSDLLPFGCKRVIFKMDTNGNALEIDQSSLNRALKMGSYFSVDKFRHMCILAGCDYLPSLQGIGLGKARKFIHTSTNPDMRQVLKRMPLQMKLKVPVTQEYIDGFIRADNTFLYQLAFDPRKRKLMPLHPYPPELADEEMDYAGRYFDSKSALQLALGNVDTGSLRKIFNFEPDTTVPSRTHRTHKLSIWHEDFRPAPALATKESVEVTRNPTKGQEMTVQSSGIARRRSSPRKRKRDENTSGQDVTSAAALATIYGGSPDSKTRRIHVLEEATIPETPSPMKELDKRPPREIEPVPQRNRMTPRNVFAVKKNHRVDRVHRENLLQSEVTVSSRFFPSSTTIVETEEDTKSPDQLEEKDDLVLVHEDKGHIYEPGRMDDIAAEGAKEERPELQDSIRDHQRKSNLRGTSPDQEENEERRQKTPPSSKKGVSGVNNRKGGAFHWSSQVSKSGVVQKTLADSMKSLSTFHRKSNSQVMKWKDSIEDDEPRTEGCVANNSQESLSDSQRSGIKSSQVESEGDFAESQSSSNGLSSQRSIPTCSIDRDGPTFSQLVADGNDSPVGKTVDNSDAELSPGDKEICDLLADMVEEEDVAVVGKDCDGSEASHIGTNTKSDSLRDGDDVVTSMVEVINGTSQEPSSNIHGTPTLPSLGGIEGQGMRRQKSPSNDENSPPLDLQRKRKDETVSSYFTKGKESQSNASCKVPGLSKRKKPTKKNPSSNQQPTLMAFMKKKSAFGSSGPSPTDKKLPLSPSKMEFDRNITPESDNLFTLNKASAVRKTIFK